MDYKDFDVSDFLKDEYFVEWVLHPDHESDHFWKQWLFDHTDKLEEVEHAREVITSVGYAYKAKLSDPEYSAMFETLLRFNEAKNNKSTPWLTRDVMKVAASIVLILAAALMMTQRSNFRPDSYDSSEHMLVSKTVYGQKKNIVLSDGTRIMLNAGSSLTYPEKFSDDAREVILSGEAFFNVEHDVHRPFLIKTSGLTTKVLGTSFNVRSYTEDDKVLVSVVTGKVEINSPNGTSEVLLPSDMGTFSKSAKEITVTKLDKANFIAWTKGILTFDNETLPNIFEKLERWYGVEIQVSKGVKLEGKYSGSYKNKSLELILKGISYTSNFKYSINNKKIIIYEDN